MASKQNISKIEAASRQFSTAVQLFFAEGDEVSIHTLVAAAHGILFDISHKHGIDSLKDNPQIRQVPGNMRKTFIDAVNEAQNFFKHADKDPKRVLQFNPEQTEVMMVDVILMYQALTKNWPREFGVMLVWAYGRFPQFFAGGAMAGELENLAASIGRESLTDRSLYRELLDKYPTNR